MTRSVAAAARAAAAFSALGLLAAAAGVAVAPSAGASPAGGALNTVSTAGAAGGASGGYVLEARDGGLFTFGDAEFFGSAGGTRLNQPIVGMAATPDGRGYWLVARDGGVFSYGDARFYGSTGAIHLNQPIVGIAATADGGGYWLVAGDGGVFSFGDARFYGSTGAIHLNQPIIGMAAAPDGLGYWLVASDGGIFSYGDAGFHGSTGAIHLNQPIIGMAATADGGGYWLAARDGGVFSFGDARFHGSTGAIHLNQPIVAVAATADGGGYWLAASDGGVFTFGDAGFYGSTGGHSLNQPVVGMATVPASLVPGSAPAVSCPADGYPLPGQGPSVATSVSIPAVPPEAVPGAPAEVSYPPAVDLPSAFAGTVMAPAGAPPGTRPAVVLLHGVGGSQCQLWWLARYLAGEGFVTVTLTSPTPAGDPAASLGVAITAARSAISFLAGNSNPFRLSTDPADIGVAGWSEGSIATSLLQELPDASPVKAVAALDNLRASFGGDPGAPVTWCVGAVTAPVTPRVPALGMASDTVCPENPGATAPTLKLSGWSRWRAAGVPAVEEVMAGFNHFDFSAPTPGLAVVGTEVAAWFSGWLRGDPGALGAFRACQTGGFPTAGLLSARFSSAAYLPSQGLDTEALAATVAGACGQPAGVTGSTPDP